MEVKRRLLNSAGIWLGSLLLAAGPVALGNEAKVPDASPLGAESFSERELAGEELWRKGKEGVNLLNALSLSDDPETVWRARQILRWVDMEITPDTPAEIVELVESYLTAGSAKEREVIYNQLLNREAYAQLFSLPNHVSDKVVAGVLAERVAELAGQVAEERIIEGKEQEALKILTDAKTAKAGLMRWISLVSAMGLRDEYWPDLTEKERIMLARWEGDIDLLEELVGSNHEVQLTLQLLNGEILPYLESKENLKSGEGLRAKIAKAVLAGQENGEENRKLIGDLVTQLEEKGATRASDVLGLLAQMGYLKEALPFFEKEFPISMFEYYRGSERIEEAFRVIGLEVGEPVPEEWIESTMGLVGKEFEVFNEGCGRILSVGQFYHDRGELKEAERLFAALLVKMDQLGINEVASYLALVAGRQRLTSYEGYSEFAIQMVSERQEEFFSPENFLSETFFPADGVLGIYRRLKEWKPELSEWDRVRALFALNGKTVNFSEVLENEILEKLEKSAAENQSTAEWETLRVIAAQRGDLALTERAVKALNAINNGRGERLGALAFLCFSDGRFEESAELFEEMVDGEQGRIDLLPYLAVALEKTGRKEEAEERLMLLEKLALGDGQWLVTLGGIWGYLGDWEKQREIYQRALLQLPSKSTGWVKQMEFLADAAYRAEKWAQSAALREAAVVETNSEASGSPALFVRERGYIDFARAMDSFEKGEDELGDLHLKRLVDRSVAESFYADDVFYELRRAGLHEQAEALWEKVSPVYRRSLELFPKSHNAHNTAAWVAARAACDLDEAARWVAIALKGRPGASAYLDTKAEVFFAKGRRKQALRWSGEACRRSENSETLGQLRVQYRHFRDDPFPLKGVEKEGE